jgi:hypothetical protein
MWKRKTICVKWNQLQKVKKQLFQQIEKPTSLNNLFMIYGGLEGIHEKDNVKGPW